MLALLLFAAAPLGSRALLSAALGGALEALNLFGLEWGVRSLTGPAGAGTAAVGLLVAARVLLVLVSLGAVMLLVPVDPLWFAIGLSSAVPSVIWHGLSGARERSGAPS